MSEQKQDSDKEARENASNETTSHVHKPVLIKEIGGPKGLEPTRYGDWERNGRCIDF